MLTFDKVIQTDFGSYVRGFCLPTDEKPVTGIANGSMLEEINPESGVVDTYRFDGENAEWVKIISDGTPSGGGGSGGGGLLIVHGTESESESEYTITLDKTWREIHDAGFSVFVFEPTDVAVNAAYFVSTSAISHGGGASYFVDYVDADFGSGVLFSRMQFETGSADGYPVYHEE